MDLRCDATGRIVDGFDWLGFHFERRPGRPTLRPADKKLEQLDEEVNQRLGEIRYSVDRRIRGDHHRRRLQLKLAGWAESFTLREEGGLASDGHGPAARTLVRLCPVEPEDEVRRAIWDALREMERRLARRQKGNTLIDDAFKDARKAVRASLRAGRSPDGIETKSGRPRRGLHAPRTAA